MDDYQWYDLDPDNRKDEPLGPHCARCKKQCKNGTTENMKEVVVHPTEYWFRLSEIGEQSNSFLGSDCFKKQFTEDNKITP